MTKKVIKPLIAIMLIILSMFIAERIYNSRDELKVTAMDASYYGIVETNLTTEEKLQDFEYLYDVLKKNYPFFKVNERLYDIDWLGNKSKYERMIKNTQNDAEFLVAISSILKDLNNGHTMILNGESYKWLYKSYNIFLDEYEDFFAENYGEEFLSRYEAFKNPDIMHRYKFEDDVETLESIELFEESVLESKVLIKDKVAYMKIKNMADYDVLEEDYLKIKGFLKDVEDYEKLIVDIRGNRGGGDEYWKNVVELLIKEPISTKYYSFFKDDSRFKSDPYNIKFLYNINKLEEKTLDQFPEEVKAEFDFYKTYTTRINPIGINLNPPENIEFNGKVYVLVDKNVFSASETFASFAKDTGFAILVGEITGGDRVFEDIPVDYLPNSKFVFRYSNELGINQDGTINMETRTTPHIYVDPTPHEDFNKDECIQAVIRDGGSQ